MDERTLRELYLGAFEIAVREGGPSTVMCAYPKLNGVHCSDSKKLLGDILRGEWGFGGLVVTDWGAMNDRVEGFRAGCDLCMPGGGEFMWKEALEAVRSGELPEKAVDDSARRVLELVRRASGTRGPEHSCDYAGHHELARRAAEAGAVLLKNEDGLLPLAEGAKIAVIGHMAGQMRYQGSGSSHINPTKLSQPLDFLPGAVYARGCDARGCTTAELLAEAAAAAKGAEAAVVFAGLPERFESEGFDRGDMRLPEGQLRMIEAAAAANPNTAVVLFSGGAVECPWADRVRAVLYMGLPGQAGGEAAAALLYGRANPGGRLAESWPYRYADVPSSEIYGKTGDALYEEGIYVGYRYYDKSGTPGALALRLRPELHPVRVFRPERFGGQRLRQRQKRRGARGRGGGAALYLAAARRPAPARAGAEGFRKVFLQPGESKTVSFELDGRSFAVWQDGWRVPGGTYTVRAGGLSAAVEVEGETLAAPAWQAGSWYESCSGKPDRRSWEAMLGREYTPPRLEKGSFTMDNTVDEMRIYSLVMRLMYKAIELVVARGNGGRADYDNQQFRMQMASSAGAPLRNLQICGGIREGSCPACWTSRTGISCAA